MSLFSSYCLASQRSNSSSVLNSRIQSISKYLNGGNVLPENRKSIEKAIAELGYEVNEVARWLATNKTKTIGVLVYNIQSLFNGMLLSYIGSSLHTLGYGMLICDSADNPEQETRNIQFLLNKKVDGILAIPVNGERHEFGYAEKVGVPVVLIDRPIEGKCCVKINNSLAARQATELLLDNNHTIIAIIGSNPEYTGRRRCDGFFSAMTLAGLKVGENLIANLRGDSAAAQKAAFSGPSKGSPANAVRPADKMTDGSASAQSSSSSASSGSGTGGVDDWKTRKEEQARRRKIANDLKKCENEISRLEAEGESLDTEISLPENSTDPDKLRELTAKREAVDEKLASLYEQWESLSELAEEE